MMERKVQIIFEFLFTETEKDSMKGNGEMKCILDSFIMGFTIFFQNTQVTETVDSFNSTNF